MGKINVSRWILGGIIAGVVADILGTLVDGVILAPRWTDGMKALGIPVSRRTSGSGSMCLVSSVGSSQSGSMPESGHDSGLGQ